MMLDYYRGMLTQEQRVEAFRAEIFRQVKPGDRVLEIGSGLGTYSFFAAQAGASRVWSVEVGSIIPVARALAQDNGLADRITFLRGWYPEIALPEPVDILIYEDYPSRLLDAWTYPVLRRLHAETLRPGARVIPSRARMMLAPVNVPLNWSIVGPFGKGRDTRYGIDWSASREYIVNTPLMMPIAPENLLQEPRAISHVRLDTAPDSTAIAGGASWEFSSPAVVHGLGYWFDLEVGPERWLSNAPGALPGSWGYLYLPVEHPIEIPAGGSLSASVTPLLAPDGTPRWLTWEVSSGSQRFRGHEFKSFPATLDDLAAQGTSWIPRLSAEAAIERAILNLVDGQRSIGDIGAVLMGMDVANSMSPEEFQVRIRQVLAGRAMGPPNHQPDSRNAKAPGVLRAAAIMEGNPGAG